MKKEKHIRFMVLCFLFVFLPIILCGCGSSSSSGPSPNGVEKAYVVPQEKITSAIVSGFSKSDFKELIDVLVDKDGNNRDLSNYIGKEDLSGFIISEISKNYESAGRNLDSIGKLLFILESCNYKDQNLLKYVTNLLSSEEITLTDKMVLLPHFNKMIYYDSVKITQSDIDKYVRENGKEISMKNGNGGYYDDLSNRFTTKNRDIQRNGDIITTSAQYFGDFAILNTDREYLDSFYQIHHSYKHELYFRKCKLADIDKIDTFQYAPPYLFSTYEGKTVMFEVDDKTYASIIYTVK